MKLISSQIHSERLFSVGLEFPDLAAAFPLLKTLEQQLRRLVLVVDAVCTDMQKGHAVYDKIFSR